jgi:hypothetical protein
MGLTMCELVAAVEDTFGFAVADDDAGSLDTMGELYDYVLAARVHARQQDGLDAMALYKIRRGMMSVLRLSRNELPASRELAALIPAHRRQIWRKLEQATGLRMPLLRRPGWVIWATTVLTVAGAIAVPVVLHRPPLRGAFLVGIVTLLAVGYLWGWLTAPLTIEFQPDCRTVGQLATGALARNYQAIVAEYGRRRTEAEVWERLQVVVGKWLGVPPDALTRESSLVDVSPGACR